MGETWSEPPARSGAAPVRLLARVLFYDDLLTDVAQTLRIEALRLIIGRGTEATAVLVAGELRVPDRWLSGGHAMVRQAAAGDVVADLGSRNGTWVNGVRLSPDDERVLVDGDLIEVGHTLLCYRRVSEADAAALDAGARLGPTRTVCPEIAALLRDLARIAPSREPVLIQGETGAGKEMVAETIHRLSGRPGTLRAIDCGAVPETLFEATFFGHQRGAFTGAAGARQGEIVRADRGTLLLDEVGNLSAAGQAKLLRVLEEGRVTPLGAEAPTAVDVRWIAATNRDLLGADAAFRADLVARLAGFVARVPPLRRRREDLGILGAHLLAQAGIAKASITVAAARVLFNHELPGNVRQLRSVLRSAALLAAGAAIEVEHLPAHLLNPTAASDEPDDSSGDEVSSDGASEAPRRRATPSAAELEAALAAADGNVVHAAESFGTSARQLYRWIQRLGVSVDRFR